MQEVQTDTEQIKLIAWPSPQDYNEAVQNPSVSFRDPELTCGEAELTNLGLPKPATGNFASVYKMSSNGEQFAVRCFLHPLTDQQRRYAALDAALENIHAPYTVPFHFIEQGILVHGHWHPLVKMQWAHGEPLIEYIQSNLYDSDKLNQLAQNFRAVLLDMKRHGIAHGDLQHGNIFIDQGAVKLVDYDGFFVPSIASLPSNELGHRNYQHPKRDGQQFDAALDNFSGWVIYLSLLILREDPSVWDTLNGGDECLLFRADDFKVPVTSRAFQLLENHHSTKIRAYTRFLRSLLQKRIADIPDLSTEPKDPRNLPALEPLNIYETQKVLSTLAAARGQQLKQMEIQSTLKTAHVRQAQQAKATRREELAQFETAPVPFSALLLILLAAAFEFTIAGFVFWLLFQGLMHPYH